MRKKMTSSLKLIVSLFLGLILVFILSTSKLHQDKPIRYYDTELLKLGMHSINLWDTCFFDDEDINISLTLAEEYGGYYINESGNRFVFVPVKKESDLVSFSPNEQDLNRSQQKEVKSAYHLIEDYILQSSVLMHKEELTSYLASIQLKTATFATPDVYFDYKQNIIFIDANCASKALEWKVVREYVRALSLYTYHGKENGVCYRFTRFDEMMTDAIAVSILEPDVSSLSYSAYSPRHYEDVYPFIGIFQEKAIDSYFYGYSVLFDQISEVEFNGFVDCIEILDEPNEALHVYSQLILKWKDCQ